MQEFRIAGKGLASNDDFKSWTFFSRAILSISFNKEAVKWTKLLFEELKGNWKSLSSANNNVKGGHWILISQNGSIDSLMR
ncbi:cytochrome p450 [Gigaspora margarita]|uniref:Cytochrome p450 n=1 Tax=Gigaspora margarita TaxID=4874 RepID=A0A8H4AC97_GIGMA|nr:cytochrome p450 [Gigaspora margarita]